MTRDTFKAKVAVPTDDMDALVEAIQDLVESAMSSSGDMAAVLAARQSNWETGDLAAAVSELDPARLETHARRLAVLYASWRR